ncbi:MAG TPA: NUDIX hydrolase [Desulfuromonadales bacterium]|nr:NUDIX hydrolase [Desulfuromonadales bacterium]
MNSYNHRMIFKGMVFDVEQLDVQIGEKGHHTFQVIRHPGGAGVLPVHEDGTVTLIRQLRPAVTENLLEIAAGRLDPGEPPSECARRELLEETGLRADELISLGRMYSSPGVFDEIIHLYAACDVCQGESNQEEDEDIETVRLPLHEALTMAADGRINDSKTLVALFRWQLMQNGMVS